MARKTATAAIFCVALILSSCDAATSTQREIPQKGVEELSKLTETIRQSITNLETRVDTLETKEQVRAVRELFEQVAFLTPGEDGYSIIAMELGKITISLDDVKPYANGSRVTLRIGNTTSATIRGAQATIEWGILTDQGTPDNASARSRKVEFVNDLEPGSWTKINVVLDGTPPANLGFVRVRQLQHSGIQLRIR